LIELEIEILSAMVNGENSAFEKCYQLFSTAVYNSIVKICRDESIANDLLQDTFIDAFKSIATFNRDRCFLAWIKKIGFNNTLNHLRKVKRQEEVICELTYLDTNNNYVNEDLENQNLLEKLLDKVSETERMVLWLSIVEQYSHEEIGKIFNKSDSFSKSILSRTLKKLKIKSEVKKYAR